METIFDNPGKYEEKYITVDGQRTHFFEAGKGDPLVLVHGAGFMGAIRWYPVIIPLSRHFHVYAVDELGQGFTDPPRYLKNMHNFNVKTRAEHVLSFIETLKLGKVNLCGQSQGGWIVTYIALKRPELVNKLILVDSGSTAGGPVVSDYRQRSAEFQPTKENLRASVQRLLYATTKPDERFIDYLVPLAQKWGPLHLKGDENLRARERVENLEDWRKLRMSMYNVDGKHISEYVKEIKTPTFVIWAKQSLKTLSPGVELFERMPNAELHVLDKANHFCWIDQPDSFNNLVTWFLTKG